MLGTDCGTGMVLIISTLETQRCGNLICQELKKLLYLQAYVIGHSMAVDLGLAKVARKDNSPGELYYFIDSAGRRQRIALKMLLKQST